jgi:hypothetical protein
MATPVAAPSEVPVAVPAPIEETMAAGPSTPMTPEEIELAVERRFKERLREKRKRSWLGW